MAPIDLPTELWEQIRDELIMPELRELSLTCRYLRSVCARRLLKQQRISDFYRWIDAADARVARRIFVFHDALYHILRGELSPTYIFHLEADEGCIEDPEPVARGFDVAYLTTTRKKANKIKPLIRRAVEEAFWIDDSETEQFVEAICFGKEDEVLCILVPLLTNLRALRPPYNAPLLERTIRRIAIASASPAAKLSNLPLRKLLLVFFHKENGEFGASVQEIMPYAALPSVRRVVLPGGCGTGDGFDGWSAELPLSRVSEVYFHQSDITKDEVSNFARGFTGPCIMLQSSGEWEHLELSGGGERVEWCDKYGRKFCGIKPGSRSETLELSCSETVQDANGLSVSQWHPRYADKMNAMLECRLLDWKVLEQHGSGFPVRLAVYAPSC